MNRSLISFFFLLFFSLSMSAQTSMNVMSFNIRLNVESDELNSWPYRKGDVAQLIQRYQTDIFGVQEALAGQMDDMKQALPDYQAIGVGRDDGRQAGEFSAIFYLKSRFALLDSGTFWLSETPETPSKGWDAALNRICTWVKLQEKSSGEQFYFFNTHFDHVGVEARAQSAKLIIKKIEEMTMGNPAPVIVSGDFNLTPDELPVKLMTATLRDARVVSLTAPLGTEGTFNAFDPQKTDMVRIDYVFVNQKVEVLKYQTVNDLKADGRTPSDHYPVLVKAKLTK